MVVETMGQQKLCQECNQKHDCQKIYQQLGNVEGPSVVIKVIFAFLLPLVVFIVSLTVSERILAKAISTEQVQTAVSLLLALLATFVCILITRVANRQFG